MSERIKQPEVGDIAIIRGPITEIRGDIIYFRPEQSLGRLGVRFEIVSEVIAKPWEPKVGDYVHEVGDILPNFNYKVLAIHGSGQPMADNRIRRWAVIAHEDDIPKIVMVNALCAAS